MDNKYCGWTGFGTMESAQDTWKAAFDLANNLDCYTEIRILKCDNLFGDTPRNITSSKVMSIHLRYQKVDVNFIDDTELVNWQEIAAEISNFW